MASIAAELVSVERLLWSGEATMVTAQTTEGEIGVLPGHEPLLGQLVDDGVVIIHPVEGDKLIAAVQGGFLSISKEKITILADYAVWDHEVDEAAAEATLQSEADSETKSRAEAELRAIRRKQQA